MCLSTVYSGDRTLKDSMLAEYVTSVNIDGNTIRLLDITGEEKIVQGSLRAIDLVGNTIFIDPIKST